MRLGVAGLVFVAIAGASCGGTDSAPRADPSATQATLQQTCPEVEAELPRSGFPKPAAWSAYSTDLERLRAGGDTETQNALSASRLIAASDALAAEPSGIELLDAREAMRDALDMMATRCHAVGSSALQ